jgi:hypothetical protein
VFSAKAIVLIVSNDGKSLQQVECDGTRAHFGGNKRRIESILLSRSHCVDPHDDAAMLSKMVIHELADLGGPKKAISLRRSCLGSHCE